MSEERKQMSSDEMIRRAKEAQRVSNPATTATPAETDPAGDEAGVTETLARYQPSQRPLPPPPPPRQRPRASSKPLSRVDDMPATLAPESVVKKAKSTNWFKMLWIAVVIGVIFISIANRDEEPTQSTQSTDPTLFTEEFGGGLSAGWEWENEVPGRWSIDRGFLRLNPPPVDAAGQNPAQNVLLRSPGVAAYSVVASIDFSPSANFHAAGITIYQDEDNTIQLVHGFCTSNFEPCVDEGVYFDRIVDGGIPENQEGRALAESPDRLFLRIDVNADVYVGWYSIDGETWASAGVITAQLSSPRVGLIARSNEPQPPVSSFDFFVILP